MDTPILIGIHGAKGAGKDTTARFVMEWAAQSLPALSAVRRGFADIPKWAFARQFFPNITQEEAVKWADTFKNTPLTISAPFGPGVREQNDWTDQNVYVQFRQCMDQFATQGAREIYGDDFWVDQLLPRGNDPLWTSDEAMWLNWWHNFSYKVDENSVNVADFCLITDLRAANEVERIKQLGGFCVKIRRYDAEQAVEEEFARLGRKKHLFHTALPDEEFDFIIDNDDNDMDKAAMRTRRMLQIIQDGTADSPLVIS